MYGKRTINNLRFFAKTMKNAAYILTNGIIHMFGGVFHCFRKIISYLRTLSVHVVFKDFRGDFHDFRKKAMVGRYRIYTTGEEVKS